MKESAVAAAVAAMFLVEVRATLLDDLICLKIARSIGIVSV